MLLIKPSFFLFVRFNTPTLASGLLIMTTMEEENISVRELAKQAKVSPTTIQNLRSGNAETVKFKTLSSIMQRLGYVL